MPKGPRVGQKVVSHMASDLSLFDDASASAEAHEWYWLTRIADTVFGYRDVIDPVGFLLSAAVNWTEQAIDDPELEGVSEAKIQDLKDMLEVFYDLESAWYDTEEQNGINAILTELSERLMEEE